MIPIVQTLKDSGYHCRIVPLRFGQALEPERVAENWVSSIAAAFGESATLVGEPRYCVAYSLGALVTLTFLQRAPEAFFDRLFLIAPP